MVGTQPRNRPFTPCSAAILRKPCSPSRGDGVCVCVTLGGVGGVEGACQGAGTYAPAQPRRRPKLRLALKKSPSKRLWLAVAQPAHLDDAGVVLGVGLHVALDHVQRGHHGVGGAAGHHAAQAARDVKVLRAPGAACSWMSTAVGRRRERRQGRRASAEVKP